MLDNDTRYQIDRTPFLRKISTCKRAFEELHLRYDAAVEVWLLGFAQVSLTL